MYLQSYSKVPRCGQQKRYPQALAGAVWLVHVHQHHYYTPHSALNSFQAIGSWYRISQKVMNNAVDSMLARLRSVIGHKGQKTTF
jgi:hypothetical protein